MCIVHCELMSESVFECFISPITVVDYRNFCTLHFMQTGIAATCLLTGRHNIVAVI